MAEFKEDQEVEALRHEPAYTKGRKSNHRGAFDQWTKAEIVVAPTYPGTKEFYTVRFKSDGSHGFIEADHIRPVRGDDT